MLVVKVPKTFFEERIYILEVLLKEYLGLHYKIKKYSGKDYLFLLPNDRQLVIRDNFFSHKFLYDNYLDQSNIPRNIVYTNNPFIVEKNIPIIYGTDEIKIGANRIVSGIDVFASSYFMLTRWEEYVNKNRDSHNRFPATESVAYKNNFLHRPVVNEYVEMLWNMLKYLEIDQDKKSRQFQFINTHDVDHIYKWNNLQQISRVILGNLIKSKNLNKARNNLLEYINVKLGRKKDPFDTFDWLMTLSEKTNIKSRFYFMSGGVTRFDNNYQIDEKKSLEIIREIKERDHIIGFHPSYNSYNKPDQWMKEKEHLEEVLGFETKEGRQHYLRFEAPYTWQIWENNNMEKDSTLSYADKEGFRCGTCYEYPVFNFIQKKTLRLMESPLIAMEITLMNYSNNNSKDILLKTKRLINLVKKYNGQFVFLWHNSSFKTPEDHYLYKNSIIHGKNKSI